MTIYIDGNEASKNDLHQLESDIKAGKVKVFAKATKNGDIELRTEG